jgi:hypothetical protein
MQRFLPATPHGRLALFLVFLWFAALALTRPSKSGDFQEYALMTIALANHASPDIRPEDITVSERLSPEIGFVEIHRQLRAGMARGDKWPFPGFVGSERGGHYAIHFLAYSALAAIPFGILDGLGAPPFKAFQFVNMAALTILVLALYRFSRSVRRTVFATLLFLLSGGLLYSNWCSPEFMTASALLAALVYTILGRPYLAALLAGVAAMQNPPLVFFSVFAPLIRIAYVRADEGLAWPAAFRRVLTRHTVFASILQAGLAALPAAYNYHVWGVPSIIAVLSTYPPFITPARLVSFYFDLNQGMIVAFPVVMLLVLVQLFAPGERRWLPHTLLALLFSLALAIPSLSTVNWNSGASGVMRYAFWGAMPLLYLALGWMQRAPRWPLALLLAMLLVQAGMVKYARSYHHEKLGRVPLFVLHHFPALYEPEPEIFFERITGQDGSMHPDRVVAYPDLRHPKKILFNVDSAAAHAALCGPGGRVAPGDAHIYPLGWRYIDGAPVCAVGTPVSSKAP